MLSAELRYDRGDKAEGLLLLWIIEVKVVICNCESLVWKMIPFDVLNDGGASQNQLRHSGESGL